MECCTLEYNLTPPGGSSYQDSKFTETFDLIPKAQKVLSKRELTVTFHTNYLMLKQQLYVIYFSLEMNGTKWTACLAHTKLAGRQPVTLPNPYIWPVPLPDNNI